MCFKTPILIGVWLSENQRDTHLKEIGLRLQTFLSTIHLITNTMGWDGLVYSIREATNMTYFEQ